MKKALTIFAGLLIFGGAVGLVITAVTAQTSDKKMTETNKIGDGKPLPALKEPFLLVKKQARRLELYDGKQLVRTYNVALGFAPTGDKETEGDGKTPEGDFYVFTKNPKSQFYLSLGISYPGLEDARRGLAQKLITQAEYDEIADALKKGRMPLQKTKLGGEIYIHGGGNSEDWTWGCVALTNEEIKELFDAIPVGTRVRIEA